MTTQLQNAAERLSEVETQIQRLRSERNRARKVAEAAKRTVEANDDDSTLAVAVSAKEAAQAVDAELERLGDEQAGLLRQIADAEAGSGFAFSGVDGWREAATKLDLQRGETRVDLAGASMVRPMAQVPGGGVGSAGGPVAPSVRTPGERAASRTILYPWALPQEPFGTWATDSDFVASFSQDAITGIERNVDETTTKADLGASIGLATPVAREFAITAKSIPARVFDNEAALRAFLEGEMRRRLDLELDQHVVTAIEAATPPNGLTGSDLIAQVRHGVAAHRALGSSPSVLALNPDDSAALDLTTESGSGAYVFVIRGQGADVLWTLTVVESPAVTDPILIDPARLGVLKVGAGSLVADPFTAMDANLVRLRAEVEARAHIRSAVGAYVIAP